MQTIKLDATLRPVAYTKNGKTYYEQVLLIVDGYPTAVFHVDALYGNGCGADVLNELTKGRDVTGSLTFETEMAE